MSESKVVYKTLTVCRNLQLDAYIEQKKDGLQVWITRDVFYALLQKYDDFEQVLKDLKIKFVMLPHISSTDPVTSGENFVLFLQNLAAGDIQDRTIYLYANIIMIAHRALAPAGFPDEYLYGNYVHRNIGNYAGIQELPAIHASVQLVDRAVFAEQTIFEGSHLGFQAGQNDALKIDGPYTILYSAAFQFPKPVVNEMHLIRFTDDPAKANVGKYKRHNGLWLYYASRDVEAGEELLMLVAQEDFAMRDILELPDGSLVMFIAYSNAEKSMAYCKTEDSLSVELQCAQLVPHHPFGQLILPCPRETLLEVKIANDTVEAEFIDYDAEKDEAFLLQRIPGTPSYLKMKGVPKANLRLLGKRKRKN